MTELEGPNHEDKVILADVSRRSSSPTATFRRRPSWPIWTRSIADWVSTIIKPASRISRVAYAISIPHQGRRRFHFLRQGAHHVLRYRDETGFEDLLPPLLKDLGSSGLRESAMATLPRLPR